MASQFPSRWLVLEVARPVNELSAELAVDALARLSGAGVEERSGTLIAYFDTEGQDSDNVLSAVDILSTVRAELEQYEGLSGTELRHRWQAHEDWAQVWRIGITPRRVGDRIVICPTWETPPAEEGDLLILIDPGMAFGTAEHATTRGCLRLLEQFVREGQRVADIGTGSGILSVASVLLGAERVAAVDNDPRACATAEANARLNGVHDRIDVIEVTVGQDGLPGRPPFSGIVANIEAGVLTPRLELFRSGIDPGGWLILAGVLDREAEGVSLSAAAAGFSLVAQEVEGGWWAGAFSV